MSFPTAPATHHQAFYGNKPPQDGPFYAPSLGYHQKVRDYLDYCNASYKGATFDPNYGNQLGNVLPSPSRRKLLNSMVQGIADDGILSQLDVLWAYATDGSVGVSFTNIITPSLYTCSFQVAAGAPSYAVNAIFNSVYGFNPGRGNFNMGVNTGFNPSLHGVNMTQDNNSVFCFVDFTHVGRGSGSGLSGEVFGNSNTSGGFLLSHFGNYQWRQNGGSLSFSNILTRSRLFFHSKRTSSTNVECSIDGVLKSQQSDSSVAFASAQMTVGKNLANGQLVNSQYGVFGCGASLAGLEDKLNYRVQKYMAGVI